MGVFSRLISRKKKDEVEELFSDIGKESKLFEEFLRKHEEKISIVKGIMKKWNKGLLANIEIDVKKVLELNHELLRLIGRILKLEEKDRTIFRFIIKEKLNKIGYPDVKFKKQKAIMDEDKYKNYSKELEPYFNQLFDALRSLLELISLQIDTIRNWKKGTAPAIIVRDITQKKGIYHLLLSETVLDRRLKKNFILVIRTINQFLGYEKKFGLQTRVVFKPKGEIKEITTGVIIYEVTDLRSRNFNKFYRLYQNSFPQVEIEGYYDLKEFLEYEGVKLSIKEGDNRAHLVIAVVGDEVIGLTLFSTTFIEDRKICYAHGWWTTIDERYRNRGILNKLVERRLVIMKRDAKHYGVDNVDVILVDTNDPRRMNNIQLKTFMGRYKLKDPYLPLKVQAKLGFQPFKFRHKTPPLPGKPPIEYELLMIIPFRREWIRLQGVPLDDMLSLYWYDVRYGYDRIPQKEKVYWEVRRNIINGAIEKSLDGKKRKVVPFGWD